MHGTGRACPQQLREHALPRRGIEQVHASHNICDALICIIDDDDKLVRPQAVSPLDDEITHFGGYILALWALPEVDEANDAGWNAQAPGACLLARCQAAAACAWIRPPGQLAPCAGAAIHQLARCQLFEDGPVAVKAV